MKLKAIFLLLSGYLFASCATVFNSSHTHVPIRTSEPARIVLYQDTLRTAPRPAIGNGAGRSYTRSPYHERVLVVRRSRKDRLNIEIFTDSTSRRLELKPALSNVFWYNLLSGGLGMLADLPADRARTYASRYVDFDNGESCRVGRRMSEDYPLQYRAYAKGRLYIITGASSFNVYTMPLGKVGKRTHAVGMAGIFLGMDYHYSDSHSLAVEGNISTSFRRNLPRTGDPDKKDGDDIQYRFHISLYNNFHRRRLSFGYGVDFSRNMWKYRFRKEWSKPDDPAPPYGYDDLFEGYWTLGPIVNAYWKATKTFRAGLVYRPSIYRLGPSAGWQYGHDIGLEARFCINAGKRLRL